MQFFYVLIVLLVKVSKSFSFLGYQISQKGIGVAKQTLDRFYRKLNRLYEQGAWNRRLVAYVKRCVQWVKGGVVLMNVPLMLNNNTHPPKNQVLALS